MVCILDRPRHKDLIALVRTTGARIKLISDGDVSAVIATTFEDSGVDLYLGAGGSPEGVLAAAALRCLGGVMYGKLIFSNQEEKKRAQAMGIKDLNIALGIPVIFGVLTDDTMQQAENRSGGKHGNKGVEAAITAIKMAHLNK